jgi:glycosyltransferase involved in cell wall biosynthesis
MRLSTSGALISRSTLETATPGAPSAAGSAAAPLLPRRILFVEASLGGVVGGSLTGILHLISRLDRRRYAPSLALWEPKDIAHLLAAWGVPLHTLPPPPMPKPARGNRLSRALVRVGDLLRVVVPRARALVPLLRREQPALVYLANGLTSQLDGVIAAAISGFPMLCHEKGFRRVGPVERFMSRWVDVCVGMSEVVTRHYRGLGVRPRRFLTIYDGINCDEFPAGGGDAVRRELGIPADTPLVGVVGHIQGWKGQLLAVEALARARARCPDLRCLIVGGVHRTGTDYAAEIRRRVAALGLGAHVVFTGARRDIAACMDAIDVVVHSSVTPEPFGRVLIEAMALGRALIAPGEGGPLEIIVDGETGLLVPPRDPDALADAIVQLIADPQRRRAMGRAARARVDAAFDIRHHVRAMEALFDEILGAPALATSGREPV